MYLILSIFALQRFNVSAFHIRHSATPMISCTDLHPWLSSQELIPSLTLIVTVGSIKLAVPISIAVAPAMINSMASSAVMIPPRPTTGILTALATCQTILTATGLTAGPLSPPVPMLNLRQRFSMSMDVPISVFISDTLSAPSASTARANYVMSVTFGDSFTISVL